MKTSLTKGNPTDTDKAVWKEILKERVYEVEVDFETVLKTTNTTEAIKCFNDRIECGKTVVLLCDGEILDLYEPIEKEE